MDRGYSSGVNREEPETTTLLPFCDKLFIYSNDDDNDDDERKSEFGGPSSARSVKRRKYPWNILLLDFTCFFMMRSCVCNV